MYYPLSQITSNLYTNGNEFQIKSTRENYKGNYWKSSTGQFFTGKTPQDSPVQELILIDQTISSDTSSKIYINYTDSDQTLNYDDLKNIDITQKIYLPYYTPTLPTNNDYQIGEMRRFFCKKVNEILYLEIDEDTYTKLVNKNPSILYQYYQPFNIPWQLTGDKEQVHTTNRNIVALTMKNQKLPQFDKYLKEDYVKYYKA